MSEQHDDPRARSGDLQASLPYQFTYRDFIDLKVSMARLEEKLGAVLIMRRDLDALDTRVTALELAHARSSGRTRAWGVLAENAWALVLALVAAFAGYLYPH